MRLHHTYDDNTGHDKARGLKQNRMTHEVKRHVTQIRSNNWYTVSIPLRERNIQKQKHATV